MTVREVTVAETAVSFTPDLRADAVASHAARRALSAAFIGFCVDMFDVYLPIVALAPAMSYFQPASLSPVLQSTLFYVVFAVSLVGRPLGATLFGHFGDKFGRRKISIVSTGGFAFVTLLIGLLPGYESLGIFSTAMLTFLRFVDGVFLGGEYTAANPLAMEYAPKEKRGVWAALIQTGYPISVAAMSLITTGLLHVLPSGSPYSPYVQFGWRIPFFLGAILAGGVSLYCIKNVPESHVWAKSEKPDSPLRELFRGSNFGCFFQVFLVMSGVWFMLNVVTSILPGILLTVRHVNSVVVTNAQLIANLALVLCFLPVGMLGQRVGRRPILILFGLAGLSAGPALYYWLVRSGYHSALELTVLLTLINLSAIPVWAVVTSYINERFPVRIRASGYGISYSSATIIPAFSSFYMLGLKRLGMPYEYTEIAIFALGGLLLLLGGIVGPETKDAEL
jgi:MFS family permease